MIVKNPEVTLEVEAHGIPEGGTAGFLDWMLNATLHGDDGKLYEIGPIIMSMKKEKIDMVMVRFSKTSRESAKIYQLRDSIYKVAEFTDPMPARSIYPAGKPGSLKITKSKHEVLVECGDAHITIKEDNTWFYDVEDKKNDIRMQLTHRPAGYPTWYGHPNGEPSALTTHSIAYGYFWSGPVDGTLTIKGKTIKVEGKGVRERYIAVDTSPAEIGGWEDWMWFGFDELYGCAYEFKLGLKDMSFYFVDDDKQYCPGVDLEIIHNDWAYLKQVGVFIPTHYKVIGRTDAGTLKLDADVAGGFLAGSTGKVPDSPVFLCYWDNVVGIFTYKDGRVKTLTNGLGNTSIRCWKPYPNIISPALATEAPKIEGKPISAME